ncbi:MAG: winged helix-turn-helix domain-containing protein [Candidatus Bathyarchaeia archaeon]|jgi:DNA-binding Lrp family transcriptional regulator
MDPLDIMILNHLRDGKPKEFKQILAAVKLSHNTLRHHLDSLVDQNLITKSKEPVRGRGKPKFTYSVPVGAGRASSMLPNPSTGVVSLSFSKLSQICRFEKGGWCKKIRGRCYASDCPKSVEGFYNHFRDRAARAILSIIHIANKLFVYQVEVRIRL